MTVRAPMTTCPLVRHAGFVLLATLVIACGSVRADTVRVMGFAGASNWPVFVGQALGFFARDDVAVEFTPARSSALQMRALVDGGIDVALTAFDNLVARVDGAGDAAPADLVAVMGINHGARFTLIAAPSIRAVRELAGRRLAVDAVDSGYALVLREMLRSAGLEPHDYALVSVGGSGERFKALRDGAVAATLLNAPVDAMARAAGFVKLADSVPVVPHYQGSVAAVRRAWADEHRDILERFIRAYVAGVSWLYDARHRAEAIEILMRHAPGTSPEAAVQAYGDLVDRTSGTLSRGGALDIDGMRTVLALRARFAPSARAGADPARYFDASFLERAAKP